MPCSTIVHDCGLRTVGRSCFYVPSTIACSCEIFRIVHIVAGSIFQNLPASLSSDDLRHEGPRGSQKTNHHHCPKRLSLELHRHHGHSHGQCWKRCWSGRQGGMKPAVPLAQSDSTVLDALKLASPPNETHENP